MSTYSTIISTAVCKKLSFADGFDEDLQVLAARFGLIFENHARRHLGMTHEEWQQHNRDLNVASWIVRQCECFIIMPYMLLLTQLISLPAT